MDRGYIKATLGFVAIVALGNANGGIHYVE